MKNIRTQIKDGFSKDVIVINVLFSIIAIIITCQSSAFLFNPFIIIILCGSYVVSFSTLLSVCLSIGTTSFIIDKMYGLEILMLIIIYVIYYLASKVLKNKTLKIYSPLVLTTITISLIYYLITEDAILRINSLVLCLITLLGGINTIKLILQYKENEEVDTTSLGMLIGSLTLLFLFLETFAFLWISFILLFILRMSRKELYLTSTFVSFILLYYLSNYSINLLICIYSTFLVIGLINYKYSYFFFVPVVSLLLLSISIDFYFDTIYYQLILGFLLMCLVPNSVVERIKIGINYLPKDSLKDIIDYQNNKFKQISSLCSLLMDDRFDKYEKLDQQLEKSIKEDVCDKCTNRSTCKTTLSKYLTGRFTNEAKDEIFQTCIYPYQISKTLFNCNKRLLEYSEREEKSIQSKKIMNNAYQILKEYIDLKPRKVRIKKKFSYDFEVLTRKAKDSPNGDAYRVYEDESNAIIMLSDGMGHTHKSRDISQYLIELINYLILISNDGSKAIDSANQILLAKTYEEVYATLDLGQLDLEKGILNLYKAGSFPTFLIRGKTIREISTNLPPIGIINNVHINQEEIELRKGDIVLFMTDGFGENVAEIVRKTIQKAHFLSLKNYLKFLQNELIKESKNDDDQTLVAIKINKS